MNSQQAKSILEVWRAGGAQARQPEVAEALRQVERDPELARWFEDQRAFDSAMTSAMKEIPVPSALRASILAANAVVPIPFRQHHRARWALAASLLLLAGLAALLNRGHSASFADYRREVIEEAWGDAPHLELNTSDVGQIRRWLVQHDAKGDFTIPTALRDLPVTGCRLLEWRGHKAAMICFAEGIKHTHLFVMDRVDFADMPPQGTPAFEKCGGWKTISWSQGPKTYVLSGMNYLTFVKKFRKSGHWLMAS
jgi:hypothetical protein